MTRNQISGAIGLIIGLGLCVVFYLVSPPGEFGVPWIAVVLIVLGLYYLFFKTGQDDAEADVDPADRVRKLDAD